MLLTLLVALVAASEPSKSDAQLDRLVGKWVGRVDTQLNESPAKATVTWTCERSAEKKVQCRRSTATDGVGTDEDVATFGHDRDSARFQMVTLDDTVERHYVGEWREPNTLEMKRDADDAVMTVTFTFSSEKKIDFQSSRTADGKTTQVSKGTLTRQAAKK